MTDIHVPFVCLAMSTETELQIEKKRERYERQQVEILIAAAHPGRFYAAYMEGWHMRVGMN